MRDSQITKANIINVASDLFASKGYRGTSIRDIAKAAGITIPNIYHYFGNKEGLLLTILEDTTKYVGEQLLQISKMDIDPMARFKLMIKTHIVLLEKYRNEAASMYILPEESLSAKGKEITRKYERDFIEIYRKELCTLQSLGHVRCRNVTVCTFNILGIILWRFRWYKPDGPLTLEEIAEEIISFIFHGILDSPGSDIEHGVSSDRLKSNRRRVDV